MCLTPSTWKVRSDEMMKVEARSRQHCAAPYPVHRSASKVNRSGADAQVVSYHCYLVYHLLLLTVFYISGLVLASSSVLQLLNLEATSIARGIMSVMCQTGT